MKHPRLLVVVMLIALAIGAGCGDDDYPICPVQTQSAVAVGTISLQGNDLYAYGDVVGLNGHEPDLDSVIVHDMKADVGPGMSGTGFRHFYLSEVSSGLISGDTVDIEFYTTGGVSTTRAKVLSFADDRIQLVSGFMNYDSGATAAFAWNQSPNADWYYVRTTFAYRDSTGEMVFSRHEYVKTIGDTTLTVPGDSLEYNGSLEVQLQVGTGPDPTSTQGNISGGTVRGYVTSTYQAGYGMTVGSGIPPGAAVRRPESPEDENITRLTEMIERFAE